MRYFSYLSEKEQEDLFYIKPSDFFKDTEKECLRYAVGGLLYIPATDRRIAQIVISGKIKELSSLAICLEDAVGDQEREVSIRNLKDQFSVLSQALQQGETKKEKLPLLFVRVKEENMLYELTDFFLEYSYLLTGVILPKITSQNGQSYLERVSQIGSRSKDPFYAMPILESEELIETRDRRQMLYSLEELFSAHRQQILSVRIGATDLSGLLGIRRSVKTPIYQIAPIASVISDILQVFGRRNRYTVSGPVWEYFHSQDEESGRTFSVELNGLLQETFLDRQNGIVGKTCIHPSQLLPVQASYIVSYENYQDALHILDTGFSQKGVLPSSGKNRMNEMKPHALWARKTLQQASIYGVFRETITPAQMLQKIYNKEMAL